MMFGDGPFGMFDFDGDGELDMAEAFVAYSAFDQYERDEQRANRRSWLTDEEDDDDEDDDRGSSWWGY